MKADSRGLDVEANKVMRKIFSPSLIQSSANRWVTVSIIVILAFPSDSKILLQKVSLQSNGENRQGKQLAS